MAVIYSAEVKTDRMTATRDHFANGTLEILTAADVVLATFGLSAGGGAVSADVWTLAFDSGTVAAVATGDAAKAQLKTAAAAADLTGLTVGVSGADINLSTGVSIVEAGTVTLATATLTHSQLYLTVNYYVSPLGSDANDGLSELAPWLTPAKVNASVFSAGSVINMDAGNGAFTGQITLNATNCPNGWVELKPYNGAKWALNSTAINGALAAALTIDGVNEITVRDGHLKGTTGSTFPVTLDPSPATASLVTLTNGNLTATYAGGAFAAKLDTTVAATENLYYELSIDALSATPTANDYIFVGLLNNTADRETGLGSGMGHTAYRSMGQIYINDLLIDTLGGFLAGDVVRVAVSVTAFRIWFAVNGGLWNEDAAADPAAGVGGYQISAGVPFSPAVSIKSVVAGESACTIRIASADWSYAAPSGFVQIEPAENRTIYGIWLRNSSAQDIGGILIDGMETEYFNTTSAPTTQGAHIWLVGYGFGTHKGFNGLTIRNCKMHGTVLEDHDDCGIQGYGNGINIRNVLIENNEVYNIGGRPSTSAGRGGKLINFGGASGSGIIANGWSGAEIKNNYVHDISANLDECGGPAGIWGVSCNSIYIHHNEIARVHSTIVVSYGASCDFVGLDWDISCENCLAEFNYTHENDGAAYLFYGGAFAGQPWRNNHIRFNLSVNDGLRTRVGLIASDASPVRGYIYNNTILQQTGATVQNSQLRYIFHAGYGTWGSGEVFNNIAVHHHNYPGPFTGFILMEIVYSTPNLKVHSNVYKLAHPPHGKWSGSFYDTQAEYLSFNTTDDSVFGDPLLVSEGAAVPTLWPEHPGPGNPTALTNFQIQGGSPADGVGLDIATVINGVSSGDLDLLPAPLTTDFWGNTVTTESIGAHCP